MLGSRKDRYEAINFYHYTPHIDLAFSSVEYIMRDGASCNVLVCFYLCTCLKNSVLSFKTMFRKPFSGMKPVICLDCPAKHLPFVTFNDGSRLPEIAYSFLYKLIINLSFMF